MAPSGSLTPTEPEKPAHLLLTGFSPGCHVGFTGIEARSG